MRFMAFILSQVFSFLRSQNPGLFYPNNNLAQIKTHEESQPEKVNSCVNTHLHVLLMYSYFVVSVDT